MHEENVTSSDVDN